MTKTPTKADMANNVISAIIDYKVKQAQTLIVDVNTKKESSAQAKSAIGDVYRVALQLLSGMDMVGRYQYEQQLMGSAESEFSDGLTDNNADTKIIDATLNNAEKVQNCIGKFTAAQNTPPSDTEALNGVIKLYNSGSILKTDGSEGSAVNEYGSVMLLPLQLQKNTESIHSRIPQKNSLGFKQ
jgi:hypothetical protein